MKLRYTFLLIGLLLANTILFAQEQPEIITSKNSFNLIIGSNYPFNYSSNELIRKFGGEIGFAYSININNNIFAEIGLVSRIHGREDVKLDGITQTYAIGDSTGVHYYEIEHDGQYSYFNTEFTLPLYIGYNFNNSNFELKAGIIYSSTIKSSTDYVGSDPELLLEPLPKHIKRNYFSFGANCTYKVFKGIKVYLSYNSPFNNTQPSFGLVSMGLLYRLNKNN